MSTELFNPLIPGLNPDPSIVRVGDDYYLISSTFEYLPGLPIYHSTDFQTWTQIGNVAPRAEQLGIRNIPTHLGVYAPTIRHRDGVFYVIVTIYGGRGCVIYTATDPAGTWSEGTVVEGLAGIDPDLAWDEDGTAYVTYSGTVPEKDGSQRATILQVRVNIAMGQMLEEPRELWSGTGLKFPEAPHLYHRGEYWYLLIAEGGTERGHAVSIARSDSPRGPFEGASSNPILSARSTSRPIQNTGHGDLVELPDGTTGMVLLGMRPLGMGQAYSLLGRETFATRLTWVDGWPVVEPVNFRPRREGATYEDSFFTDHLDVGWLSVRRPAAEFATFGSGKLTLTADHETPDGTLDGLHPAFLGRRQSGTASDVSIDIDTTHGTGGLTIRYDNGHHADLEARQTPDGTVVTARLRLAGLQQQWQALLPAGPLRLNVTSKPSPAQVFPSDVVEQMIFTASPLNPDAQPGDEQPTVVAEIDGRYLSAEVIVSFTGRVVGPYCNEGSATFRRFRQHGTDDNSDD